MQSTPEPAPSMGWPSAVEQLGLDAEERQRGRTGLGTPGTGQRRDQNAAGLGLPPGIDDRALLVTDVLVIPHPGLGVDRLANRAEQAQAGEVALLRPARLALAHQRANRGRSGVELVDLVLVADIPEATGVGISRDTLEHDRGGPVAERAVDDVRVAGDPADVGGAPVDVAVVIIEDVLVRQRRCRPCSRRWCAARPWACRSSRRCRG